MDCQSVVGHALGNELIKLAEWHCGVILAEVSWGLKVLHDCMPGLLVVHTASAASRILVCLSERVSIQVIAEFIVLMRPQVCDCATVKQCGPGAIENAPSVTVLSMEERFALLSHLGLSQQ